jgi:intracellular septation protein
MMGHAINMPEMIWLKLNRVWIFYFIVLGAINLIVAYTLTEAAWLQFKVFGNLAITLTFVMGQMPVLMKHIEIPEENEQNNDENKTKDPA